MTVIWNFYQSNLLIVLEAIEMLTRIFDIYVLKVRLGKVKSI